MVTLDHFVLFPVKGSNWVTLFGVIVNMVTLDHFVLFPMKGSNWVALYYGIFMSLLKLIAVVGWRMNTLI